MKLHFTDFLQKMLDNDHAEIAPPLERAKEHWYLPTFGVYHPQKPDQIKVVFDSSAEYEGVSLKDVLLHGPDLNNTLLGVLLCFRRANSILSRCATNVLLFCRSGRTSRLPQIPVV